MIKNKNRNRNTYETMTKCIKINSLCVPNHDGIRKFYYQMYTLLISLVTICIQISNLHTYILILNKINAIMLLSKGKVFSNRIPAAIIKMKCVQSPIGNQNKRAKQKST